MCYEKNFKQWCSSILPVSTKQTITSHLSLPHWTQERPQHMPLVIYVLAWYRHRYTAGLKTINGIPTFPLLITRCSTAIHILLLHFLHRIPWNSFNLSFIFLNRHNLLWTEMYISISFVCSQIKSILLVWCKTLSSYYFGFVAPKTLNHFTFQYVDFKRTWCWLFQKRVVRTKFDIYVYMWISMIIFAFFDRVLVSVHWQ